jgi:TolB-like protein
VGNQLRITARVLGVADGDLVGSVKVDGTLDALDQLTDQMITAVRTELGGAADPAARPSRDPDTSLGVALALFANISRNPADEQLGQNLKTALTNGLQQLERVSIVPIEAPDDTAALNAASDQRATWLITGGYQRVADQLRVTAHLLDVETGDVVQTVKVDGTLDSVVALQERVQAALEDAVRDALSASDTPDTAAAHGADARTDRTLGQDS